MKKILKKYNENIVANNKNTIFILFLLIIIHVHKNKNLKLFQNKKKMEV